jgi:hypothetical protein
MMISRTSLAGWSILTIALAASVASAQDKDEKFKETYTAFAVAMGVTNPPVIPPGVSTTLQINITRWTTPAERESLFATLVEKGQEGLVKAVHDEDETGFLRVTGRGAGMTRSPSVRIRYAWQWDLGEGKRRIVLATDRPIYFWEAVNRPRWSDYDMTLLVMDIGEDGKGEGELAIGVRLAIDTEKKQLVIENFGSEPVRLNSIRRTSS